MVISDKLRAEIEQGEHLFQNGKLDKALKVFEAVLEKEPNNVAALNDKGVTLNSLGRYREAIQTFLGVLQKDKINSNAVFNLISNYFAVDEWGEAENILSKHGHCLEPSDVGKIKIDLEKFKSGLGKNIIDSTDIVKGVTEFDYGQVRLKDQGQYFDETPGVVKVNIPGRQINFKYPNSIYMRNIVSDILQGKDYPSLRLPNYFPKIIIDVGANIGATALYFYSYFPDSHIYCYEPSPINYKYLKENTKHFDNINTFPYGLFDRACKMPLYFGKDQCAQDSIIKNNETSATNETVTLVKVSEEMIFKSASKISILKIDTEGCEIPILNEIFKLEDLDIDMIYVEYHSEDDRIEIDKIVSPRFLLRFSRANQLHRGTTAYFSKALVAKYPGAEWQKIT